jgi:signal transduction histidine kinase
MGELNGMVFAAVLVTLLLVIVFAFIALLLVVNSNRRQQHRAALAEAELRRDQEVTKAEREATEYTLRDVGRELHDNVAQTFSFAQLGMNGLLADAERDAVMPDPRLVAARDALDEGLEEVRRLAHSLDVDLWKKRSLGEAITAEAARIERVSRVRVNVVTRGKPHAPPPDTSTMLFRVFQEVVHNAMKHSGADTLTFTLDGQAGLTLTLADNGTGFDPGTTEGHSGLANIHKRCAVVGYSATCTTEPGKGCSWLIQPLPLHGS